MPFGLTNAPAVFQCLMQRVLKDLNPQEDQGFVTIYIDEIWIYSRTLAEHLSHLNAVMSRLINVRMKLKPSKCSFVWKEVNYLGHVITPNVWVASK